MKERPTKSDLNNINEKITGLMKQHKVFLLNKGWKKQRSGTSRGINGRSERENMRSERHKLERRCRSLRRSWSVQRRTEKSQNEGKKKNLAIL